MSDLSVYLEQFESLAPYAELGLLDFTGVQLANQLKTVFRENDELVLLAAGLAVRAWELGSTCLIIEESELARLSAEAQDEAVAESIAAPVWPDLTEWLKRLSESRIVRAEPREPEERYPLRLIDNRVYLERNWVIETQLRRQLSVRFKEPRLTIAPARLAELINHAFPSQNADTASQVEAVKTALSANTVVIAGGPGTGKTTTIARLLACMDRLIDHPLTVSLAAFTGKAATRMSQSLAETIASDGIEFHNLHLQQPITLHRLLAAVPNQPFRKNRFNQVDTDILIIDEMSMVSLPLMAGVLNALSPNTKLILVGDPDQLASVEAGNVLADIIAATTDSQSMGGIAITRLTHNFRSNAQLHELAEQINAAQSDAAIELLTDPAASHFEFIDIDPDPNQLSTLPQLADQLIDQASRLYELATGSADEMLRAEQALAILDEHRLLCAHREGRYGVANWTVAIHRLLAEAIAGYGKDGEWYAGRPILFTRNDAALDISNGDTGVVIIDQAGNPQVALDTGSQPRLISPWLLSDANTMQALTVHKSQGSEYRDITLVLPGTESKLLSRQLLYTAVTRAKEKIRLIGSAAAFSQAVQTQIRRATGLAANPFGKAETTN